MEYQISYRQLRRVELVFFSLPPAKPESRGPPDARSPAEIRVST
jgi:hypothetical protein